MTRRGIIAWLACVLVVVAGVLAPGASAAGAPTIERFDIDETAPDARSLRSALTANQDELAGPAVFWVAYPKANRADIDRDTLWPILGEYGMRPITQVAVDDVWSALRFRPLEEGEPPFTGGR